MIASAAIESRLSDHVGHACHLVRVPRRNIIAKRRCSSKDGHHVDNIMGVPIGQILIKSRRALEETLRRCYFFDASIEGFACPEVPSKLIKLFVFH